MTTGYKQGAYREATKVQEELKRWLVRRVECIRGSLDIGKFELRALLAFLTGVDVEIFPAFGYANEPHVTTLLHSTHHPLVQESKMATFHSDTVKLQLDVAVEKGDDEKSCPNITFQKVQRPSMLGEGLIARVRIEEGQAMSFVLRNDVAEHVSPNITSLVLDGQQHDTQSFWYNFISQSNYKGRWMEVVSRSLMILKMMTYGKRPNTRTHEQH